MALPGQTTLGQIRATVRQRSDTVGNQVVTDAELNGYIDASRRELHDLLVQSYGDDYFVRRREFTTDSAREFYELPADCFKLLGVDVRIDSFTWLPLRTFMFAERGRFSGQQAIITGRRSNLFYRLSGGNIWLAPQPASGLEIRLTYVPRLETLKDTAKATVVVANMSAGNSLHVGPIGEELTFTCVASGASGQEFNRGATPTLTAAALATVIGNYPACGITATNSGAVLTATAIAGPPIQWWVHVAGGSKTLHTKHWENLVDGVDGWEEYIVVDAVLKVRTKQEEDTSSDAAAKGALIKRIEAAAANRDAGSPATIADTSGYGMDDEDWL